MPPLPPLPTDAELEVLNVLWSRDWATVHEVFAEISARRDVGYTTVLKFLQVMLAKGLVQRDESRRKHLYHAVQPRDLARREIVSRFIERAFDNSPMDLVRFILANFPPSPDERRQLIHIIEPPASPTPSAPVEPGR